MKYQKGFIVPLLLALIATLLIGGGAYVYVQNNQTNQPAVVTPTTQATSTAQSSDSQTANWKMYRNEQYGFEFKNSPDLQFIESKARYSPAIFVLDVPAQVIGGSSAFFWVIPENLIEQQFRPLKFKNQPKNLSQLADELTKFNNTKDQSGFVRTITAKEISTESVVNGVKITIVEGGNPNPATSYLFYKSPYFYEFLQAQGDAVDAQLAKIVPTFEFLK
jgi:hypothetical protein